MIFGSIYDRIKCKAIEVQISVKVIQMRKKLTLKTFNNSLVWRSHQKRKVAQRRNSELKINHLKV